MGDFNDLKINEILNACAFKQVVKVPTRKEATLDLILTNKSNKFYKDPITLPSISTSDHLSVLYEPIVYTKTNPEKTKIITRKFHKSAMIAFGAWLISFDWSVLLNIKDVNLKVAYFFEIMWVMIDKFFPPITIVATKNDKEWITPKIKSLIAVRQKAHQSGDFLTRDQLKQEVITEVRVAKRRYKNLKAKTFSNTNTKEWYRHITNIINNGKRSNILLNNVPELAQKTPIEIVNTVNNHFASICQTYPSIKDPHLNYDPNDANLSLFSEMHTYKLLNKFAKKVYWPKGFS